MESSAWPVSSRLPANGQGYFIVRIWVKTYNKVCSERLNFNKTIQDPEFWLKTLLDDCISSVTIEVDSNAQKSDVHDAAVVR